MIRGEKPAQGDRIKVVVIFICNNKGEYLIQKSSVSKGHNYTTTGGHVGYGESERETVLREVQEELGLDIVAPIKLMGTISFERRFMDVYYVRQEVDLSQLNLQAEEVESACFMTAEEIKQKIDSGEFLASHGKAFLEFCDKK